LSFKYIALLIMAAYSRYTSCLQSLHCPVSFVPISFASPRWALVNPLYVFCSLN